MTVLITGGTGAVGSATARHLVKMGIKPILYNRHEDYRLLNDIRNDVICIQGDILDRSKLIKTIKAYNVKIIIHTVSLLSKADPKQSIKINTEGTVNVLWAAVDCKVNRVVYTSSKAVYSEICGRHAHPHYDPINEDYPTKEPLGIYGVTKYFGEQIGRQFQKNFGLDFIALRFSTIFGPGRLLKNADSPMVIPCRIIESAMSGQFFAYPKGAEQKDDYISIDETGRAVVLACFAEGLTHRVFNIGTQTGATLMDFARAAQKIFPAFNFDIGPGLDHAGIGFNFYSRYDISRAENELTFSPKYNLEEAVVNYVGTMRKLGIEPVKTSSGGA
jgi:UDP-glucose 4-epimerase